MQKSLEEIAEEKLLERFGKTRSALGSGTVIQGKLAFDTTIRIDGKLSGDIFSSKAIIVGKSGFIDASIDVSVLVVVGKVKGQIKASERVEIIGGGSVEGTVESPRFVVEEGSTFNGQVRMRAKSDSTHVSEARKLVEAEMSREGYKPSAQTEKEDENKDRSLGSHSEGPELEKKLEKIPLLKNSNNTVEKVDVSKDPLQANLLVENRGSSDNGSAFLHKIL
jgi:cytoskeletal protein CcmA (bactofilin family)